MSWIKNDVNMAKDIKNLGVKMDVCYAEGGKIMIDKGTYLTLLASKRVLCLHEEDGQLMDEFNFMCDVIRATHPAFTELR